MVMSRVLVTQGKDV
jgi:hypothetical protein